ncbi:MAG: hypothetical protein KY476_01660 [Planctomycetes bacterium]|nr:hypothetical protein [Planctomycetota bacterium]
MSGNLTIVKFCDAASVVRQGVHASDTEPLGTVADVKAAIERHIPAVEWEIEPSLVSIMQRTASESWRNWDSEMLAAASRPKQNGHCHSAELSLSFESLPVEDDAVVAFLLVEMRSIGNPWLVLRDLCHANSWTAVGLDHEIVDFGREIARWEDWQQNQERYLAEARLRRHTVQAAIASHNASCADLVQRLVQTGANCPRCSEAHREWRCVVPSSPDRPAYIVCRRCGRSCSETDLTGQTLTD